LFILGLEISRRVLSEGTVRSRPLRVKIKDFTEKSGKMSPGLTTMPSANNDDILRQVSSWR